MPSLEDMSCSRLISTRDRNTLRWKHLPGNNHWLLQLPRQLRGQLVVDKCRRSKNPLHSDGGGTFAFLCVELVQDTQDTQDLRMRRVLGKGRQGRSGRPAPRPSVISARCESSVESGIRGTHRHQHLPSAEGRGPETFLNLMLYTPCQIMLGTKGEPDALCLRISCWWIAP